MLRLLLKLKENTISENLVKRYQQSLSKLHSKFQKQTRLNKTYQNDANFTALIKRQDTLLVSIVRHPFER